MTSWNPSISIDPEADAAYVAISGADVARTEEVADGILVDYDADGRPVGIEVLSVRSRVGTGEAGSYLRGLAEGVLATGQQAAE
ncbi:MAG TPA: DUF2283 domain-containing protein [Beijerinckiaceae bacterium]|jgi:uncharacterized protein YuzE|nr:DUF2283 domain-containing protein [Beijerinckiaceae bacterium]